MVAYGRIPDYHLVSGKMTAEEYVGTVKCRRRNVGFGASSPSGCGLPVKRLLLDYVEDEDSLNYATWLEMPNPD